MFALGLNVLVGYAGLVSLGHAGLFGVAGYVVAYLLAAGLRPCASPSSRRSPSASSCTAGFAALALRATGISFIMITLALGEIIWGLAYRWISLTNGDNGISVTTRPAPFGLSLDSARAFYYRDAGRLSARARRAWRCSCARRSAPRLRGTRDQPRRMNALGYHVWMIRFWAFMFSGLLTGGRRHPVRLLQQFISPQALALHRLGRGAADGDLRRRRHAARPDRRRGAGRHRQERGERLYRRAGTSCSAPSSSPSSSSCRRVWCRARCGCRVRPGARRAGGSRSGSVAEPQP